MALNNGNHIIGLELDHAEDDLIDSVLGSESQILKAVPMNRGTQLLDRANATQTETLHEDLANVNGMNKSSNENESEIDHTAEDLDNTNTETVGIETEKLTSDESAHIDDNLSDFEELDLSQGSVNHPDEETSSVLENSSTIDARAEVNDPEILKHASNEKAVDSEEKDIERGQNEESALFFPNIANNKQVNEQGTEVTNEDGEKTEMEVNLEEENIAKSGEENEAGERTEIEVDQEEEQEENTAESGEENEAGEKTEMEVDQEEEITAESGEEKEADETEPQPDEGTPGHGVDGESFPVPLFGLKKKRKRRRKSAQKRWTAVSKRPSGGISPRRVAVLKIKPIKPDPEKRSETDIAGELEDPMNDTMNSEEGGEATGTEGTQTEGRKRRVTRTPATRTDFYIDDDELLNEMWKQTDPSAIYRKKRNSILFKKAPRARSDPDKILSEEDMEKYTTPMKQGWRREIVLRCVHNGEELDQRRKPPCDVYYHPPEGAKLRSMVRVAEWLKKHNSELTTDNFTFMRSAIGCEGETTRSASLARGRISADAHKRKRMKKVMDGYHDDNDPLYDKPEVVIERDDFLAPLIAASIKSPNHTPTRKRGRPPKNSVTPEKLDVGVEEELSTEIVYPSQEKCFISPSRKRFKHTARKSTTPKVVKTAIPYTGVENLCSLVCPGLEGVAPLLHCKVCMCLFHDKCVNYYGDLEDFTCLRCSTMKNDTPHSSGPSPSGSMHLDPNLVNTLTSLPSVKKVIYVQGSNPNSKSPIVVPVVSSAAGSLPLYKQGQLANVNEHRTSSPIILQALQSHVNAATSLASVPSTKPLGTDVPPVSIKEEVEDGSYDMALNPEAGAQNKKPVNTYVSSLSDTHPNKRTYTTTRSLVKPKDGHISYINQSVSQNLKNKINGNASIIGGTPIMNSGGYQLIPIGPPVPLHSLKMPVVQPQKLLPRLTSPMNTNSRSLLRTPSPVPLQVTLNNLLQITAVNNSLKSTSEDTVTVTSALSSPVSTTDSAVNQLGPVVVNAKSCAPLNGQLLTLPPSIVKRLTLTKPLALKINNKQINVPPSGFFQTASGLKVFLPPNTFPTAEDNSISDTENKDQEKTKSEDKKAAKKEEMTPDRKDAGANKTYDDQNSEQVTTKKVADIRTSKRYKKLCFFRMLFGANDCMECIFNYLDVKDLISASMVCKRWKTIAQNSNLWSKVRLKGVKVFDWRKAMQFLNKRQVKSLSLVALQHCDDPNRTWHQLVSSLRDLQFLQGIIFGSVPSSVLHSLCARLTQLESFCAEHIMDPNADPSKCGPTKIDFGKFACMSQLKELKLRGVNGLTSSSFSRGILELGSLSNLEILSVTSLANVEDSCFHFISDLQNIRELSLGECTNWTQDTCERLGHLIGLEMLRLEGGGDEFRSHIGVAVSNLKKLHTLVLHNLPIDDNLGSHLKSLTNLKRLVIYPQFSYNLQSDNKNALKAVSELTWLKELEWISPDRKSMVTILDDGDDKTEDAGDVDYKFIPLLVSAALSENDEIVAFHTDYLSMKELKEKLSEKLTKTQIKITYCSVEM